MIRPRAKFEGPNLILAPTLVRFISTDWSLTVLLHQDKSDFELCRTQAGNESGVLLKKSKMRQW